MEATGNAEAIALLLRPKVARVVVSNPFKTRAIAEAKVKTDKIDARILAQLLAADVLPPVWLPDVRNSHRRRLIARRMHVVRQRTRMKNQVQSILHRNLMLRPPVSDAFDTRGRAWLQRLPLPDDEREAVDALLRQLDFHGKDRAGLPGVQAHAADGERHEGGRVVLLEVRAQLVVELGAVPHRVLLMARHPMSSSQPQLPARSPVSGKSSAARVVRERWPYGQLRSRSRRHRGLEMRDGRCTVTGPSACGGSPDPGLW